MVAKWGSLKVSKFNPHSKLVINNSEGYSQAPWQVYDIIYKVANYTMAVWTRPNTYYGSIDMPLTYYNIYVFS